MSRTEKIIETITEQHEDLNIFHTELRKLICHRVSKTFCQQRKDDECEESVSSLEKGPDVVGIERNYIADNTGIKVEKEEQNDIHVSQLMMQFPSLNKWICQEIPEIKIEELRKLMHEDIDLSLKVRAKLIEKLKYRLKCSLEILAENLQQINSEFQGSALMEIMLKVIVTHYQVLRGLRTASVFSFVEDHMETRNLFEKRCKLGCELFEEADQNKENQTFNPEKRAKFIKRINEFDKLTHEYIVEIYEQLLYIHQSKLKESVETQNPELHFQELEYDESVYSPVEQLEISDEDSNQVIEIIQHPNSQGGTENLKQNEHLENDSYTENDDDKNNYNEYDDNDNNSDEDNDEFHDKEESEEENIDRKEDIFENSDVDNVENSNGKGIIQVSDNIDDETNSYGREGDILQNPDFIDDKTNLNKKDNVILPNSEASEYESNKDEIKETILQNSDVIDNDEKEEDIHFNSDIINDETNISEKVDNSDIINDKTVWDEKERDILPNSKVSDNETYYQDRRTNNSGDEIEEKISNKSLNSIKEYNNNFEMGQQRSNSLKEEEFKVEDYVDEGFEERVEIKEGSKDDSRDEGEPIDEYLNTTNNETSDMSTDSYSFLDETVEVNNENLPASLKYSESVNNEENQDRVVKVFTSLDDVFGYVVTFEEKYIFEDGEELENKEAGNQLFFNQSNTLSSREDWIIVLKKV